MRAPTESGATRRWSTHQSRPPKRGKAKQKLNVAQGKAELGAGQGQTGPSVEHGDAELGAGQGDAERGTIQGDVEHGVELGEAQAKPEQRPQPE